MDVIAILCNLLLLEVFGVVAGGVVLLEMVVAVAAERFNYHY